MLQTRRVFDLTNAILNCLFLAYLLLCCVYGVSFWVELKPNFINLVVSILNVGAWCVTGLSVILFVMALWISIKEKSFQLGKLIWSIVRMVICIGLSILVDVCSILVSGDISVSL